MSLGGADPLWIRCRSAGCGGSIHRVWGRTPSDPPHCGGLVTASTHLKDFPLFADEPNLSPLTGLARHGGKHAARQTALMEGRPEIRNKSELPQALNDRNDVWRGFGHSVVCRIRACFVFRISIFSFASCETGVQRCTRRHTGGTGGQTPQPKPVPGIWNLIVLASGLAGPIAAARSAQRALPLYRTAPSPST